MAAPKVDRYEALAAKCAANWPAWGLRKIAAMMRADGHDVSTSTVQRALRRRFAAAAGISGRLQIVGPSYGAECVS